MQNRVIYLLIILILTFFGFFLKTASAATENVVTATVTAQNIACTVSDQTITYGTLALSATEDTVTLTDGQTATNTGNVNVDFEVKGTDSSAWTLSGTQGANAYTHKFCNDTDNDCATPPTNYTALTTSYQDEDTGIAASGTSLIQFEIGIPSSSASYVEQSVNVYVQCTAS